MNVGVVCDPAGRHGDAAVAAGATGFSAGSQFFRSVPRRIVSAGGGGGGPKLGVELPGYTAVTRDALTAVDCPVPHCAAAAGDDSVAALKEHNLHYLRHLAANASDVGAVIQALRASAQPTALVWAEALERRQRESA